MSLIQDMIGQVHAVAEATDMQAAAAGFADVLRAHGLNGMGARVYEMPSRLESKRVWSAGGAVATLWPTRWQDSPGFRYICFEENPLLNALSERRNVFRYSDMAPRAKHGTYWEAFSEGGIGEGVGIVSYGAGRRVGSLALTFAQVEMSPGEFAALRMAGQVLIERMAEQFIPSTVLPKLTNRERDCLAYVAEGKSDWEISVILTLSQGTVRFHVDNARRKLNGTTRAHAVARAMSLGLI